MGQMRNYAPMMLAAIVLAGLAGAGILHERPGAANELRSGWRPISGKWSLKSNVVSNAHYGRGDMMIIDLPRGSDYRISADVRFDLLFEETHYGDAGLIIRTTDPELGVDSYKGYYAGLRPDSQTLMLGKASYDWRLLEETKLATPIASSEWYHLELAAHGCDFDVIARPIDDRPATQIHYRDPSCLAAGMAGLRSFYADASWRDVRIEP
jgi:hypothetical protein